MQVDGPGSLQSAGGLAPKPEDAKRAQQAAPVRNEPAPRDRADRSESGDTIEISAQAQEILQARETESAEGSARPEKVERARQVLQSGSYNEQGAIEDTARKVGDLFREQA